MNDDKGKSRKAPDIGDVNPHNPTTTSDPTPGAALPTHQTPTPDHPEVDHNGHLKGRNRSTL